MDAGLFPYTRRYLGTLRNHFSTIGVNGMNEMVRNFSGDEYDITDPRGRAMAIRILDHVREKMVEFQEETGHMYNLEATPAEGTTYRFAREDRKRFQGIIQAGTEDEPYYTNSSQLPVGYTTDPFQALAEQEELYGEIDEESIPYDWELCGTEVAENTLEGFAIASTTRSSSRMLIVPKRCQ